VGGWWYFYIRVFVSKALGKNPFSRDASCREHRERHLVNQQCLGNSKRGHNDIELIAAHSTVQGQEEDCLGPSNHPQPQLNALHIVLEHLTQSGVDTHGVGVSRFFGVKLND
jgi:hypothetical protein